ncbi:MAG: hypothetical protein NW216_13570 [Hyphomicrobium sp.]|nr:hypothetical protein [Hyphomicrobium sp.]
MANVNIVLANSINNTNATGLVLNDADNALTVSSAGFIFGGGAGNEGVDFANAVATNRITVAGIVSSSNFDAVRFASTGSVTVTASGVISAVAAGSYGLFFEGTGVNSVKNFGLIEGTLAAITSVNASDTIFNAGTIIGNLGLGNGADTLVNVGTINGGIVTNGSLSFQNTGLVTGAVTSAALADIYDGSAGGVVIGRINLAGGDDTFTGSSRTDRIEGGSGVDTGDLGGGGDTFFATGGADGSDEIDGGDGIDTYDASAITAATNINLDNNLAFGPDIQTDLILNFENITGGTGNDVLIGNAGTNVLFGNNGNDQIFGNQGNDILRGGLGADSIYGGQGQDQMFGGLNDNSADTFIFFTTTETSTTARDVIHHFEGAGIVGGDVISLSAIDARTNVAGDQAFTFLGAGAFTGVSGQLRIEANPGGGTTAVVGDVNGDRVADFRISLVGNLTFIGGDFVL